MEEIVHPTSATTNFTHNSNLMSAIIMTNGGTTNYANGNLTLDLSTNNGYYDWPTLKCINLTNFNNCRQLNNNNRDYGNITNINIGDISNVNNGNSVVINTTNDLNDTDNYWNGEKSQNNYWALLALILVFGTAAGNILVCLAIGWERRLQNVTNYFLMSLAITDLMVAILVMPLGILTLFVGYFPLHSEHCLVWICLDVLFCTASIMHLCTISVDRYLSLRYPMRFGRNKTRRRVTLKIIFVWLLSIAMSLPLSLMYSKNHASVLVNGTCQIPDPVYKFFGSIVCFYIPLGVMLLTYCLTVQLLARQQQNLGGTNPPPTGGWASGWLGQTPGLERRCTWRRLLKTSHSSTPNHGHSATSTDTELSNLDTRELWLPDSSIPEPTPSTMTALHQFGAEMLKLSRGLESVSTSISGSPIPSIGTSGTSGAKTTTSEQLESPNNNINKKSDTNNRNRKITSKLNKEFQQKQQHQHLAENYENNNNHQLGDYDNNDNRNFNIEELHYKRKIERNDSYSFTSTHQKLLNFKKRRRASTSSPGNKYDSPGSPPPFYRKRFLSLPKNALNSITNYSSSSVCNTTNNDCSDISNDNDDDLDRIDSTNQNEINFTTTGRHLESILKKSSSMRHNKKPQQHCYDKNRHMTSDYNDYLQLPPPCTCPYFGDVPIRSALKQTKVKILSSTANSNNSFSTTSLSSSSSSLFPITTAIPSTTTTILSPKLNYENILISTLSSSNVCANDTITTNILNTQQQQQQNGNNSSILINSTNINNSNILNTNNNNINNNNNNSNMKKTSPNNSYLSLPPPTPVRKLSYSKTASVVTWDSQRNKRRGSSFGGARTTLLLTPTKVPSSSSSISSHHHHLHHQNQHHHHHLHHQFHNHSHQPISALRRSATLRHHNNINYLNSNSISGNGNNVGGCSSNQSNSINDHCSDTLSSTSPSPLKSNKISSSPCLLQRNATVRSHHSRNSSVISRNSSRHGRIIRLEQKATKVLGVVFFTFVILWAPFFVLNLLPWICGDCEEKISHWVFDIVTWLGYASSMVNPIFYTIFNKVFRQAFKKVLLCQYSRTGTQGSAAGFNHWRPKR